MKHSEGRDRDEGETGMREREEDGSSALPPLIAHDRLRLANYAL